jgi:Glutathione S-transferase, N-terminal domain
MDTPLLWHIPLSHFSEKVRWALDYKGIEHRRRVLGPDYLIRAWRATGQGKLPVLWLDGRAIASRDLSRASFYFYGLRICSPKRSIQDQQNQTLNQHDCCPPATESTKASLASW